MPNIRPFNALIPAVQLQEKIVTRPLEDYSVGEAKLIASENDCSFLHLINPELENPYLRGTRQELIFKRIGENLDTFLERKVLVKLDRPAVFVYRVIHDGLLQTGIWTLTHINDYLEGNIKKHEHTVERRERLLADYLQQTGLDANPVLITYHPDPVIEEIIGKHLLETPLLDFCFKDGTQHQLWAITGATEIERLVEAFAAMPSVYIADGHHRIASMAKMGLHKKHLQGEKHQGTELYNFFTTVYMSTAEVKVLEFNRLVRDLGALSEGDFMERIKISFQIEMASELVRPAVLHEIGMYFNGQWYKLKPKKGCFDEKNPVEVLDVSILQNLILEPLLSIDDPRTDARITFSGGRIPVSKLQEQVDNGLFKIAFTLFPTSVEQLIAVADANGVMPPKSTWVEPKFLVGLITNYFN
eukprot:gene10124-11800_t